MPEAIWFESRGYVEHVDLSIVACLGFGRRDVADGLQEPPVVEPIHPFEGGELDRLERSPRSTPLDDFGLVEAIGRLGQRVVVAIADTAHGGLDARLGQAFGVLD